MTNDEADDIVEDWHNCQYPEDWELSDVFTRLHGWTDRDFETWVQTAKTPEEFAEWKSTQ